MYNKNIKYKNETRSAAEPALSWHLANYENNIYVYRLSLYISA